MFENPPEVCPSGRDTVAKTTDETDSWRSKPLKEVRPNISAIQKNFRGQCPRVSAFSHVCCLARPISQMAEDEEDGYQLPSVDHGPLNKGPWEKVT